MNSNFKIFNKGLEYVYMDIWIYVQSAEKSEYIVQISECYTDTFCIKTFLTNDSLRMLGTRVSPYFHEAFEMEVFHKLVDFTTKCKCKFLSIHNRFF